MELQKEINLINDIVMNAIIHGADCGGSYNQNDSTKNKNTKAYNPSK